MNLGEMIFLRQLNLGDLIIPDVVELGRNNCAKNSSDMNCLWSFMYRQ